MEHEDTEKKQSLGKYWQKTLSDPNNTLVLKHGLEGSELVANTSAAALGLAIALGVTNPVFGLAAASLAFAGPTRKVIEFFAKKWNRQLTLEEIVAITAPLAYLKSFDSWVKRNDRLTKIEQPQIQDTQPKQTFKDFTLDRELAVNALRCFHDSELAGALNEVLIERLEQTDLSKTEAQIIVNWVAWEAQNLLREEVEQAVKQGEKVIDDSVIKIYLAGQKANSSPYGSIDEYLQLEIASKPEERVFYEKFTFKHIYVPLKAKLVDANGKVDEYGESFFLEDWAKEILYNPQKGKRVMFIQGGPGRGKTVFCRMFADWVRQNLHPLWTPILIRLRDIDSFEQSFEKTLQGAVKADFAREDGWLTDSNLRFLFLLDGFDELRMEGRVGGGIERFINQVGSFQERCQTLEMGHRFIITGRQLALLGISYLPNNLEQVELQEMDDQLQQRWLDKWEKVVDKDTATAGQKTAAFKSFLRSHKLPKEVKKELAREPLLLYLLAAMHRDGDVKVEDLAGTEGIQTKISIYEKALNWVLTEQRKDKQKELVRLQPEQLEQVLMEAGLCVIQSGGEYATVKMIEARLVKSEREIARAIREIRTTKGDEVPKNALAAFYLKPATGNEEGSVEFVHKSFSEFLCAKRMQQSLEEWTELSKRDRFYVHDDRLLEEIYDLLGYGPLTAEIVEYLFGLLAASEEFKPEKLFQRLEDFYERWCEGEFIDAPPDNNYPQQKMRRLREQKPQLKEKDRLGLLQVDVYTGLNVMILLLELHRYGRKQDKLKKVMNFHPCGKRDEEGKLEDPTRSKRVIGYSCSIGVSSFVDTVGLFLSNADLINTDLSNVNLSNANLNNANLINTDLSNANLSNANLSNANLSNANLSNANLINADLREAKLIDANLSNADLSNADLRGAKLIDANLINAYLIDANLSNANLSNADLREAYLSGALFDDEISGEVRCNEATNWNNVKGLDTIINMSQALKQKLLE